MKTTKGTETPLCPLSTFLTSTSQIKVNQKTKIKTAKLTAVQVKSIRDIFKDYGTAVPSWLRQSLKATQRRTAEINKALREAGLDQSWCRYETNADHWSSHAHSVWHILTD